MKRMLFICGVVITVFIAASSVAQMGGQQKEGMAPSQMKGGQMMGRDMMMSMTEMMKHMNQMLEGLSHPMRHMTVTDHAQMHDMGKVMRKMAAEMTEMAVHMEKGEMDAATAKKMQERMNAINQEIDTMQKKSK